MANGTLAASQIEMLSLSGTGIITITPPATNTNRAITLPDAAGAIVVSGTTPSLNGVTFPATQVASADANTLDDYEEGTYTVTFTPAGSGSITLSANTAAYTKIGRVVTVAGYISVLSVASPTGGIYVNLPFNPLNSLSAQASAVVLPNSLSSGSVTNYWVYLNTSNSRLEIYLGGSTSVSSTSAQTVQAGTEFRIFVTYFTT